MRVFVRIRDLTVWRSNWSALGSWSAHAVFLTKTPVFSPITAARQGYRKPTFSSVDQSSPTVPGVGPQGQSPSTKWDARYTAT
jgi:hypothetical protein